MNVEPLICFFCGAKFFPRLVGQDQCLDCLIEDDPAGQPTPEEIAAACAEIRRGWSEEERDRRRRRRPKEND